MGSDRLGRKLAYVISKSNTREEKGLETAA